MIEAFHKKIKEHFSKLISDMYGHDLPAEKMVTEYPPSREMGDIALTFAFDLAKVLKKSPRDICGEIVDTDRLPADCVDMKVAGPGYINLFLDKNAVLKGLLDEDFTAPAEIEGKPRGKIIIEHTNINPNKAAHIGHLRNAVLGDTFARVLRFLGNTVEVQNFIDNTGVQVADVVVGLKHLEGLDLEDIIAVEERLDHFCWDIYSRVSGYYEEDPSRQLKRAETLKKIEANDGEEAEIAAYISDIIAKCHLETMEGINIQYDLLPWEGDILSLKFWERAFTKLKESEAVYLAEDEEKRNCWVMNLRSSPLFKDMEDPDKILVRSNGTVAYTAKDIAYQMWKFGILGKDFFYAPYYEYPDGGRAWSTSSENKGFEGKGFGNGSMVYNVIDVRQSYLQNVVKESLRVLGYTDEADNSIHFSYEMVALSPKSCGELGVELTPEEKKKDFIEMSGRKGIGVKADDLIEALAKKASEEVKKRNPDFSPEDVESSGRKLAVAALRYFMLKYTRNKLITFDFDEALSFEGETGPYLLYSLVRVKNIFRKAAEKLEEDIGDCESLLDKADFSSLRESPEQWNVLFRILQFRDWLKKSVSSMELSHLARYTYGLAREFSSFYHTNPILQEDDPSLRATRLLIAHVFKNAMEGAFDIMGIEAPERM